MERESVCVCVRERERESENGEIAYENFISDNDAGFGGKGVAAAAAR